MICLSWLLRIMVLVVSTVSVVLLLSVTVMLVLLSIVVLPTLLLITVIPRFRVRNLWTCVSPLLGAWCVD